jgi:hypothetical protein
MRRHGIARLLLPILLLALTGQALASPRRSSAALKRAVAGPVDRRDSGILIPRSPELAAQQRKIQRFFGYRNAAKRYLKASGARPAPAWYRGFVGRAMARAEWTLNRGGLSARHLEVLVLEDGAADGMNAASWTGELLTINRDIIDMSFHIASAVSAAGSEVEVDKNLYKLAMWERGNAPKPRFTVRDRARRDRTAEGIFMGVLLHEIGHAFKHSPALIEQDPPLWRPDVVEVEEDGASSRNQEREADSISMRLGMAGGSPDPAAFTLFFKYMTISRAISGPRKSTILLGDTASHPADVERIRNANKALERGGLRNPYDPNPGVIWTPRSAKKLIVPAGAR